MKGVGILEAMFFVFVMVLGQVSTDRIRYIDFFISKLLINREFKLAKSKLFVTREFVRRIKNTKFSGYPFYMNTDM